MSLESIYYIGQSIAVIAILGSLFAIYQQQKRTNQIERGKTESERANQLSVFARSHTRDRETLQSIRRCHQNHTDADPDDQAKFMSYMSSIMELMGQAFYQRKHNLIEPTSFDGVLNLCVSNLKTSGGQQWWKMVGRHMWQANLVKHLDQQLNDPKNSTPPITEIMSYLRLPKDPSPTIDPHIETQPAQVS